MESYLNHGIIGMVHVEALPGTPLAKKPLSEIAKKAVQEALLYKRCGVDAVMMENMHDVPYVRVAGPEVVAAMTMVCMEVRKAVGPEMPLGVQVLAANNREALAVALAAGLNFVRVEGYVFGHVADEGYIDGCAGDIMRYRKAIGAEHIRVFTDIKKKHSSHAVTADVDIVETAHAAEYFLSDGVIVTGESTGCATDESEVTAVKKVVHIPVLVGSGCTTENLDHYLLTANALIVGSYFKEDGYWMNPVSEERVKGFMDKVRSIRK